MVKYLSLFSGVEAASVAWEPLGWEPMAFAEIEPFPSAVLAARFPTVPNLGDVTAVDWPAWKAQHGSPDVIVAGSPCQAFSVAGKRLSLEDARGNLSLFTAELVRFLNPRVFIWENVPGALSTKDNAFGCLLGDIVGADAPIVPPGKRWAGAGMVAGPERVAAWRILDAQYFGVAQRRRRIFLVACPIGGPDPAEILFELESVRRGTPPSRQPREGTATEPESGAGSGSEATCLASGHANAERTKGYSPTITRQNDGPPIVFSASSHAGYTQAECAGSLRSSVGDLGGGSENIATVTSAVRRLTPIETERLQGFPDNWTAIGWRNKPAEDCPDSHRYKAMGNSMAVPVMRWLGARIDAVLNSTPFMVGIPEACRAEIERRNGAPPAASEPTVMAPAFSKRPGQQIANRSDGLCYAVTTGQPPSVVGNG